ncbi:unnamed protein product, partial [marine sediment metagenome]
QMFVVSGVGGDALFFCRLVMKFKIRIPNQH